MLIAQTLAGLAAVIERSRARVDDQARAAAQGPDVQRGRLRVPRRSASCSATWPTATSSSSTEGSAKGDPEVSLPSHGGEKDAFDLLRSVVADLESRGGPPQLCRASRTSCARCSRTSARRSSATGGFLQFVKAAETQGFVDLEWDDDAEDYVVTATREA